MNKYDWCVVWPNLYVYSPSATKPMVTYASDGAIVPIVGSASGLQMISVNNKSWLVFQHIRVQTFDYVGVGVAGSSDHLVFANMEAAGMVPYGTTPLGFYVNTSTAASDIQFLNDDAHLNYDGFKFDGAATAITLTNCRAYANREAGLKDNTWPCQLLLFSFLREQHRATSRQRRCGGNGGSGERVFGGRADSGYAGAGSAARADRGD